MIAGMKRRLRRHLVKASQAASSPVSIERSPDRGWTCTWVIARTVTQAIVACHRRGIPCGSNGRDAHQTRIRTTDASLRGWSAQPGDRVLLLDPHPAVLESWALVALGAGDQLEVLE